ncbi:hypothetical protein MHK_010635 [Candidatus Magnetomorum sp. HK-1]|nr:hypothetical protein MHK_010635 [Candidatus Magnetomorum sp. HK-1]
MAVHRQQVLMLMESLCLLFFTGLYTEYGHTQTPVIVSHQKGYVNWTTQAVISTGKGVPSEKYHGMPIGRKLAEENGLKRAFDHLFQTVLDIQIDAGSCTKDMQKNNLNWKSQIQQMTEGSRVLKKEYLSDGTIEVTVQMSMNGGFSQLALPDEIRYIASIGSIISQNRINLQKSQKESLNEYTGLVIDARGLKVTPCLAPKIMGKNQDEVYGPSYISREYAVQYGTCIYINSMESATKHHRVGNNPFVAKGIGTEGKSLTNIIISNTESARFKSSVVHLTLLKHCRVIIVVDPVWR